MDQVLPHNQVLRTSAAGLQGKGLIVTWTLCKGAAAKGTFLRHSMEELLPKDRNSRAVQMFEQMAGHSCPEIEKMTP